MKKPEIPFTYPTQEEMHNAQLACCGRCCTACETPAQYAWRKRDIDLSELLLVAIDEELTDAERNAVRLHWFDERSVTQISKLTQISPSAVSRTLERAKRKLYMSLRFVVQYQRNLSRTDLVPAAVEKAAAILANRLAAPDNYRDELQKLRITRNLPVESVEKFSGMKPGRLLLIESGKALPEPDELIALSGFFGVTTDKLLKGEINEQ